MVVGLLGNESSDSNRLTLVTPKSENDVRLQATLDNQNPTGLPVGVVSDCYDEEKEIAVSEKEFHVIKIGDKILCNVYRSANRVVTVELNEHWKDAGDKYDN